MRRYELCSISGCEAGTGKAQPQNYKFREMTY